MRGRVDAVDIYAPEHVKPTKVQCVGRLSAKIVLFFWIYISENNSNTVSCARKKTANLYFPDCRGSSPSYRKGRSRSRSSSLRRSRSRTPSYRRTRSRSRTPSRR